MVTAKVISLDRQRQRMGLSLRRVTEEQREEAVTTQPEQTEEPTELEAAEPTGQAEQAEQPAEQTEQAEQVEQPAEQAEQVEQPAEQAEQVEQAEQAEADEQPAEREAPEGTLAANESQSDEPDEPRETA
jgi:translation initiation factor 2 alpha subunit (eIF-2alpha)